MLLVTSLVYGNRSKNYLISISIFLETCYISNKSKKEVKKACKKKVQSKNIFTNTPKEHSAKCRYWVLIFIAKFAKMKLSKI